MKNHERNRTAVRPDQITTLAMILLDVPITYYEE